ncbi:peptidoglycan editing factor PgeF [Luteimicrobium xylanilyticum]|uniref:Laccase domain protein n=1 Tax=Luteimicrobium xylanilyticum TaxID=1133546 RepID=A0A5P9QAB3_9MICO|nr:polyphenol oxidase family protein [Luteimicrobium xylanilyticum]QFU98002.1 Laccase domain protein [Luteimicrobium xylanilyticum]
MGHDPGTGGRVGATRPPVPLLEVDLGPGVRAGFTTRTGGLSPAPWASLDLGLGVGDDPDRVRANRAAVSATVGTPVSFMTQVHGRGVIVVERAPDDEAPARDSVGEADALVSADGHALAVLVADCVPVLLADPERGVVGCAHAGRRGVELDVVGAAVDALVDRGARRGSLRAVVGPSVCGACYEVPEQMREDVAAGVPATWAQTRAGTPALDLPAGVAAQLAAAGVGRVEVLGICTLEDERFYSHRRDGRRTPTGRFAGVVVHRHAGRVAARLSRGLG